jgi:uridine phosphorylase
MTIHHHQFPVLEFDDSPMAVIEPTSYLSPIAVSPYCIVCFFGEVVESICSEYSARIAFQHKWEYGYFTMYELELEGRKLAFYHSGVGAPIAAAMLEQTIALGCRRFVVIGGAGNIGTRHTVGHLMIPTSAIRDEGTSYKYLPPSREITPDPKAIEAIESVIKERGIDYVLTKTWTTDAPYRETRDMVNNRAEEGCLTVEMEAAALFAVAKFRNVPLAQILYAGDDLTGAEWDMRKWQSRADVRHNLFWLAAKACWKM